MRPREPLSYWVPTSEAHDGHTLVATIDDRVWWCERCEIRLSEADLPQAPGSQSEGSGADA